MHDPKRLSAHGMLLAGAATLGIATLGASAPGWAGPSFEGVTRAIAVMHPTEGNQARGVVTFTDIDSGIEVHAKISGLPKGTRHGFHIHEFGYCSAPDASSAGAHYDPTMNRPGFHQHGMKPLGDLEDLSAGDDGQVEVRFVAPGLTIAGPENGVLGRAVLLHESYADPSDPMGSSGDPIACGTLGVHNAAGAE